MITWYSKLFFAGIGALCLSLLKLIAAGFYLSAASRTAITAAYLTYLAYLALGMAVGYFFAEEHPDSLQKTRQSVFLMGLLAPSILLAIINKTDIPLGPVQVNDASAVPSLGMLLSDWLVPEVYAQSAPAKNQAVQIIQKQDVLPSFTDGVSAALGLSQPMGPKLVWVAGKTGDEQKAKQTAQQVGAWLNRQESTKALSTTVVKPADGAEYYVTVGGFADSARTAATTDRTLKDAAGKTLATGPATGADTSAAKIVAQGSVVKGESLFK